MKQDVLQTCAMSNMCAKHVRTVCICEQSSPNFNKLTHDVHLLCIPGHIPPIQLLPRCPYLHLLDQHLGSFKFPLAENIELEQLEELKRENPSAGAAWAEWPFRSLTKLDKT